MASSSAVASLMRLARYLMIRRPIEFMSLLRNLSRSRLSGLACDLSSSSIARSGWKLSGAYQGRVDTLGLAPVELGLVGLGLDVCGYQVGKSGLAMFNRPAL